MVVSRVIEEALSLWGAIQGCHRVSAADVSGLINIFLCGEGLPKNIFNLQGDFTPSESCFFFHVFPRFLI